MERIEKEGEMKTGTEGEICAWDMMTIWTNKITMM